MSIVKIVFKSIIIMTCILICHFIIIFLLNAYQDETLLHPLIDPILAIPVMIILLSGAVVLIMMYNDIDEIC
jgi:hypothetical protein